MNCTRISVGHRLLRPALPALVLIVAIHCTPASCEKITKAHPDYEVLRLVRSRQAALHELEESCQQAQETQELCELIVELTAPLLPGLESIQASKTLDAIGSIGPFETPIGLLKGAAGGLRAAIRVLDWTNKLDRQYQAPIRDAILKSNRLLKSEDSADIGPLLDSYERAVVAARSIEGRISDSHEQVRKTVRLVELTVRLLERLGKSTDDTLSSASELMGSLKQLQVVLDLMDGMVRNGREFMESVLAAGRRPTQAADVQLGSNMGDSGASPLQHRDTADNASQEKKHSTSGTSPGDDSAEASASSRSSRPLGSELPDLSARAVVAPDAAPDRDTPVWVWVAAATPAAVGLAAIVLLVLRYFAIPTAPALISSAVAHSSATALLSWGGKRVVVPADQPVVIGRAAGPGSIELSDGSVSAQHARLDYRDGKWWLTDLGSANGTFRNGERIGQAPLQEGDKIAVGSVQMSFSLVQVNKQ